MDVSAHRRCGDWWGAIAKPRALLADAAKRIASQTRVWRNTPQGRDQIHEQVDRAVTRPRGYCALPPYELRKKAARGKTNPTLLAKTNPTLALPPYARNTPPVRLPTSATIFAASASSSWSVKVFSRGWIVTAIATEALPGSMPLPS